MLLLKTCLCFVHFRAHGYFCGTVNIRLDGYPCLDVSFIGVQFINKKNIIFVFLNQNSETTLWRTQSVLVCETVLTIFAQNVSLFRPMIIIDVPRPLCNDLWIISFQKVDAEHINQSVGTAVCVKNIIVNVSKRLKHLFLGLFTIL